MARGDKREESEDEYSTDEDEEPELEQTDAPIDFLCSIAEEDAMENILKRAASVLNTAQDVDLINMESPLLSISPAPPIAPKKRKELMGILRDLETMDLSEASTLVRA